MISNRERRLLELESTGDEIVNAIRAIEQGILGVAMQMDKGHDLRICAG